MSKVWVGNLPAGIPEREVEDIFSKFGRVRKTWIARNPPGFGFVEFEDARDAEDAVKGLYSNKQGWRVDHAKSDGPKGRGGFGGRGGDRGPERGGGERDDQRRRSVSPAPRRRRSPSYDGRRRRSPSYERRDRSPARVRNGDDRREKRRSRSRSPQRQRRSPSPRRRANSPPRRRSPSPPPHPARRSASPRDAKTASPAPLY